MELMMNERVLRAKELATKFHTGQVRKHSNLPYIVHPEAVCEYWLNWYKTRLPIDEKVRFLTQEEVIDSLCILWLHDCIEDCPDITKEDIVDACGLSVYEGVMKLTNPSKQFKHLPRWQRKAMDCRHIASVDWVSKTRKKCDRIKNLNDFRNDGGDPQFSLKYCEESYELYLVTKDADDYLAAELLNEIGLLRESAEKELARA